MHHHLHPTQTTQNSMSSSHPFTAVDDDDDTDICPVCDGQCTCRLQPIQSTPTPAPTPSLKIKFTLPQSLIAKRPLPQNKSSNNTQKTTSPSLTHAYTTPLKKRGRPPKISIPQKHPPPLTSRKTAAKINKKLPTFVAASAIPSISSASDSSSSTSSLSDFDLDTDSDLQPEQENFIVPNLHDKARIRKELLGGDDPLLKKRSPSHHNSDWVIRPRKKSVAGSDPEQMDVDSNLTDDEADSQADDDEDDEDDDDEDDDEPDGMNGVEDDDEDTDGRHHYVGLATGWSEEDESSFDADLFFANLSDSSSNSSTSTRRRSNSYTPRDIDSDHSSSTSESHTIKRSALESLPFEVTENWDGQLIFTNGEAESRGIVDINFEKDAERFLIDSDADDDDDQSCSSSNSNFHHRRLNYDPSSTARVPESSDIDMFSLSDADAGYEEEDGGEADEGDTTDEELVGDDCLPNERAMRLFSLPIGMGMSVSAINPMSTVSPSIGVEKRRHRRNGVDGDQEERKRWKRRLRLGAAAGPRAADILAGKILFVGDESANGYASSSDSMANADKRKGKQKASFSSSSSPSSHAKYSRQTQIPNTPRTGVFIPTGETRQVVIGDDKKGGDVPSPHPRFYRRRSGRVNVVQYLLEKHLQQQRSQSLPSVNPPPASTTAGSSPSIISETPSPFHYLLSSAAASPLTGTEDLSISATPNINASSSDDYDPGTPCPCPAEAAVDDDAATCIVELDDVLEASFLDDSMDRVCEAGASSSLTPTSGTKSGLVDDSSTAPTAATTIFSTDSTTTEASNKHLTRWDVISIGAFRQTREQQQTWGPGSRSSTVADYGRVIKNGASAESPLSALLWQNSGTGNAVGGGAGSSKKSSSSSKPTSTSTPSASGTRSSTKAAKRRRLMTSSTMSSPLVLPLSSTSLSTLPSKIHSSPLSSYSHSHSQRTPTTHKNRKELRRERKLLKRTSSSQSSSNHHTQQQPSFFSTHPHAAHANNVSNHNNNNYHHQFHTHQHHPNLKTRGTSSSQRMGFFGGAVPPLNL